VFKCFEGEVLFLNIAALVLFLTYLVGYPVFIWWVLKNRIQKKFVARFAEPQNQSEKQDVKQTKKGMGSEFAVAQKDTVFSVSPRNILFSLFPDQKDTVFGKKDTVLLVS
jgi:hypothetical protein